MAKPSEFPRVSTLDELMERFDGRMSHKQFRPYWTQLEGWHRARDHLGRTPFMVGLSSTKGRDPDLYRLAHVRQDLLAVDQAGRNLWPYALACLRYGGARLDRWLAVLGLVPAQPNVLTGQGLFVDAILNPHPLQGKRAGAREIRNAVTPLPFVSEHKDGRTYSEQLIERAGQGIGLWWACTEEEAQQVLGRFLMARSWGDTMARPPYWLHRLIERTLAPGERMEDLARPLQAMAAAFDLIAGDAERGMAALDRGVMNGSLQCLEAAGKALAGLNRDMRYRASVESGRRPSVAQWSARAREVALEAALPRAAESAPPRRGPRL